MKVYILLIAVSFTGLLESSESWAAPTDLSPTTGDTTALNSVQTPMVAGGVGRFLLGCTKFIGGVCVLAWFESLAEDQPNTTDCDRCHYDAFQDARSDNERSFHSAYCAVMNRPECSSCPDRPKRPHCRTTQ